MPLGRPRAETGGETVEELSGQRDFRQKNQRLAALSQGFRDGLEIDLGLARAGDAFEQRRRERALRDAGDQVVRGGPLIRVERRGAEFRIERGRDPPRLERDPDQRSILDQSVDHGCRTSGALRQRRFRDWPFGPRERGQNPGASVCRSGRRLAARHDAEFRRRRLDDFAYPDRHAQHHSAGAKGPAGCPVDEVAERLLERGPVPDAGDRFEIVARARPDRPDDPGRMAGPERHAHT